MNKRVIKVFTSVFMSVLLCTGLIIGTSLSVAANNQESGDVTVSEWTVDNKINNNKTTEEIKVDIEVEEIYSGKWVSGYIYHMTYTIPEDFNKDNIHFDIIGDMTDYYRELTKNEDAAYLPGDNEKFDVKVINKSAIEFTYKENSFKTGTGNYFTAAADDKVYDANNNEGYIKDAITFDGYNMDYKRCIWRTSNSALKELLNITSNNSIKYTDALINEALVKKGYEGIEELNKYYLDFMNKKYNKENTRLNQFKVNEITDSIFNGYVVGIREINPEIAALGYDLFYNNLFMIGIGDTVIENNYSGKDKEYIINGKYSIGSWMRGNVKGEEYFNKNLSNIKNDNKEYTLLEATLYLEGPYITNPYQSTTFGIEMYMDLVAKTSYTVIHEYFTSRNNEEYVQDGTVEIKDMEILSGKIIDVSAIEKKTIFNSNEYIFDKDASSKQLTATYDAAKNVLNLRYYRSVVDETTTGEEEIETPNPYDENETTTGEEEIETPDPYDENETATEEEIEIPDGEKPYDGPSTGDKTAFVLMLIMLIAVGTVMCIKSKGNELEEK